MIDNIIMSSPHEIGGKFILPTAEKQKDLRERTSHNLGSLSIIEVIRYSLTLAAVGVAATAAVFTQNTKAEQPRIKQAQPMADVGYNTNRVWVEDEGVAKAEAKDVDDTGANKIRVLVPFTYVETI